MKYVLIVLALVPCVVFAADASGVMALAFDGSELDGNLAVKILDWGTSIIGIASIITAITPTKKDNMALAAFKKFLQILAVNVRHAKD